MEPFPKRQRLFAPAPRGFAQSFGHQHDYYDDGTGDIETVDEDEEEDFEEDDEPEMDPDTDLGQRRARLDYKLKSTFEAIFEKYGKDFDGVGDEIDLATGEIVVNNGHLAKMLDERDAGDRSNGRRVLRALTDEPDNMPSSSVGETEILDEGDDDDDEDEDSTSEDELVDDDMILRGFAKANRFTQAMPEIGIITEPPRQERRHEENRRPSIKSNALPSRSDILTQFGPQLGPQIAEIISQQQVPDSPGPDDSHIEPAWRVPRLPTSKPLKRRDEKLFTLPPEPERSPSPEASTSIWAPARSRGPRKANGHSNQATSMSRVPLHDSLALDPLSDPSIFGYKPMPEFSPKRKRKNFTSQDDLILQDFAEKARHQNLDFWSIRTWRRLEDVYPYHTAKAWKQRYKRKFTYLWPNEVDEPESSETSVDTTRRAHQLNSVVGSLDAASEVPIRPPRDDRPSRIRKPAEKDSRIISWSQAVDAIESVDPDLHAGILEDRRVESNKERERGASASFGQDIGTVQPEPIPSYQREISATIPRPQSSRAVNSQHSVEISSDFTTVNGSAYSDHTLIPRAPCPHANCVSFPSNLYRVQRQKDEDLSEIILHLFRQHHTTPYPCCEINCSRKGEEGYFMQADLVRHVRISHPSVSALQRLRGRVNPELLDRHVEVARPPEKVGSDSRPVNRHVESDFRSPSQVGSATIPSVNAQFSSSSVADRTTTPRMMSTTFEATDSTRMTSISSMRVHPSSGTTMEPIRRNESQERAPSVQSRKQDLPMARESFQTYFTSNSHRRPSSTATPIQVQGSGELSDPFRGESVRQSLPTPQASLGGSHGPSSALAGRDVSASPELERAGASRTHGSGIPLSLTILDSQDTVSSSSFNAPPKSDLVHLTEVAPVSLFQKHIDPSYEFSDDEDTVPVPSLTAAEMSGPQPSIPAANSVGLERIQDGATKTKISSGPKEMPEALSPFKSVARTLAKPKPAINGKILAAVAPTRIDKPKPTPATPAPQVHRPETAMPGLDDSGDFDELSMNTPEFVLLSRPRTNPQPTALSKFKKNVGAKAPSIRSATLSKGNKRRMANTPSVQSASLAIGRQRIIAKTPLAQSAPSRKRKLDAFNDLVAQVKPAVEASSSNPVLKSLPVEQPTIKTESDDTTINILAKPKRLGMPHKAASQAVANLRSPLPIRSGTPLLDLTPSRKQRSEIGDSAAESSSPLAGQDPRTPIPNKSWNEAPLVMKTPGGTWRQCGENGFRCRRIFCFSCSLEAKAKEKGKGKQKA